MLKQGWVRVEPAESHEIGTAEGFRYWMSPAENLTQQQILEKYAEGA